MQLDKSNYSNERDRDMNFELSGEQLDIQKAAREFAEGEFPKVAEECDRNERFPIELWKKA